MRSDAATVDDYLALLPKQRHETLQTVRATILKNLPKGYEEGMQYGMIGYYVPHSVYPDGYHCDTTQPVPFAGLASQKNYVSLYLMCVYGHPEQEKWFREAWQATGKKLDMGKSCIRFKQADDIPLEVIGEAIKRVPVKAFLDFYTAHIPEKSRAKRRSKRSEAGKKQ